MAIPELLVVSAFSGGTVQAGRLTGGASFVQIGDDLPDTSSYSLINDQNSNICNRAIMFRGDIYVHYFTNTNSHRVVRYSYDNPSSDWVTVFDEVSAAARYPTSGLFVANDGNGPRLFFVYYASTNNMKMAYTDDGDNWSTTGGFHSATQAGDINHNPWCLFNNRIYSSILGSTSSRWLEADPFGLTIASNSAPWRGSPTINDGVTVGMCVFDDRLFVLAPDNLLSNNADWALWEFSGSNFSLNTTITSGGPLDTTGAKDAQPCLFKVPGQDKMVAIFTTGTATHANSGSEARELTKSGNVFMSVDITNPFIPSALRPGARGTSIDNTEDRWYPYVVNNSDPTADEVYLFLAQGPAPGSSYALYDFVNTSTELATPTASLTTIYSIPSQTAGSGDRIDKGNAAANQCMIESIEPVLGGCRVNYRVFGTTSGQSVKLYYSADRETPTSGPGTIFAQTGGSGITGGNTVTGITGDDGATLFTLDWDIDTDGVTNGETVNIVLDIR